MFVLGNFISAFGYLVNIVLTVLYWLIFFRAIISWVNPDPFNPIVVFLQRTTEPILEPIRRLLPSNLPIDLSALIAFFAIIFLQKFLVKTIFDLSLRVAG